MSKKNPWKISTVKSWFACRRLWDTFLACSKSGIEAARHAIRELITFRKKTDPAKITPYHPAVELLEVRMMPSFSPIGTANTVGTLEDTPYAFATSDFGFTDPNDSPADNFVAVKITTLPGAGTLTNNSSSVGTGDDISISDISNGYLIFTPAANANGNGYTSFTFQVEDDGTSNTIDGTARTMTIDVTSVNDAPVGTANTVGTSEDTDYTFTTSDFGYTDPNESSPNSLMAVKIVTLPGVGTLKDNGSALSAGNTVSVSDIVSNYLKFTPAANASGTGYASFTFKVQDNGGTSNGGVDLDATARTMTIDVSAVNDSPVNTVPGSQTVDEDTALVFSTGNGNLISIADVDAGGNTVQAVVTATHGTLTLSSTTGLNFSFSDANGTGAGDGTSDATMTFRGTVSSINAALAGMSYTANSNYNGGDTVEIVTNDLGNVGSGGALTDDDTVSITISAVNDAPVNTIPGSQQTDEDTPLTFSTGNGNVISVADVDVGSNSMQITLTATHGTLTLSTVSGLGFSFSDSDGSGAGDGTDDATMTFRGTLTDLNGALGGLTFTPTTNYHGSASVEIRSNDLGNTGSGGSLSDDDTVSTTVISVNDPPVNSVPSSQNTNEDTNRVFSTGNSNLISISDPDAGSSTVQVTLIVTHGAATLSGTTSLSFSFSDGNGTGAGDGTADTTMTFRGTVSAINTALAGLSYAPDANYNGSASVEIVTNDLGNDGSGGALSDDDTVSITVNSVNDAPVGTANTVGTSEDTDYTFALVDFGFTDPNDSSPNSLTAVKIVTLPGVGTLKDNGSALSADDTVSASDIGANYLKFTPAANGNGTGYASFTFKVQDNGGTSNGGVDLDTTARTMTIDVSAVNDAPVNTVPGSQSINEDVTLTFSTGNGNLISIADDAGSSNVQVALSVSHGVLTLSGVTGLSFSFSDSNGSGAGDGTADAVMTFRGTPSAINTALASMTYIPDANYNGSDTLQIVTNDLGNTGSGGVLSDTDTVNITISAVNDAPVNSVPGSQSTNEDSSLVFSTGNGNLISISDVDAGSSTVQVSLTATHGPLTLSGTSGLSFSFSDSNGTSAGDGTADTTMTFRGTISDINTALAGLTYAPDANYNGSASVEIVSNDLGNSGSGGARTDDDTISVTVTSVNDAPVGTDHAAGMAKNHAYIFASGDFGFTDPSDSPANSLSAVKITTLPGAGSITNNGSSVSAGDVISVSDINAGKLKFTPVTDAVGVPYTTFTFQVKDNGGTSNGGVDLDASAKTMTLAVASVNTQGSDSSNSTPLQIGSDLSVNLAHGNVTLFGVGATASGASAGLIYNSMVADALPILSFGLATSGGDPVPDDIKVQLIWNGSSQGWTTLSMPAGSSAGDTYDFSTQVSSRVTTTGNYPYTVQVKLEYTSSTLEFSVGGNDFVVAGDSSPYGDGWMFAKQSYLAFDGSNVALVSSTGGYAYFTNNSGTFAFNPEAGLGNDPSLGSGTLVKSGSNYIYTTLDKVVWNYNSSGQLTSVVTPASQTTNYTYSSGKLAAVQEPGAWRTELTYSSGLLTTIKDGYRDGSLVFHPTATTTFAYGSNNLTSVVDAAGFTRTFSYDGNHLLQTDSRQATGITYSHGAASVVALGTNLSTTTIAPQAVQALALLRHADFNAQVTDGNSNTTKVTLDPFGRPLSIESPSGATQSWTRNSDGLPTTYTDAKGNVTTMSYIVNTRNLHTIATPDGFTTIFNYGSTWNKPTAVIDGFGRTTTYAYDGTSGLPTLTTYPDGSTTRSTYSDGLMQTSVDANGHTSQYAYDDHRQITAVTDPVGHTITYSYDLDAHSVTVHLPGGATSVITGNGLGQLVSQIDGNGNTTLLFYTADGQISATVDGLGQTTSFKYDGADRLTALIDANGHTRRQMYDSANQITATIDANGKTSRQSYDASGNITATIDANGATFHQQYDSTGLPTATVDANGATAYRQYDSTGLLTATIDANGQTGLYNYDSHRRVTATVDANGHTNRQVYDSFGRVTATIDANGQTAHQYFDTADRITATVDANGHTMKQMYDVAGNVTATIDANGHTAFTLYDAANEVTATVDRNGRTSFQQYDSNGRVTATIDANGHTSTQAFDANGNVTAAVDANGKTSLWNYDKDNHITAMVDANGHTSLTRYDSAGNATATVDANGHTSLMRYDSANRLTATIDPAGGTWLQQFDNVGHVTATIDAAGHASYQDFDANGRVTAMVDANGHTAFTQYDAAGNATQTIDRNGYTTQNLYDADNRLTAFIDNDTRTAHFAYDNAGRLTQQIDVHGHTSQQAYDAGGDVTQSVNVTGHTSHQYYDANDRLTMRVDGEGNTTQQKYDAAGNMTTAIDGEGHTSQLKYDGVNHVTATLDGNGVTTLSSYDGAGNKTVVVDPNHNTTTMAFDGDGRLTQTIDQLNHTTQRAYDAAGNVTQTIAPDRSSILFSYDADNRETQQVWYDSGHSPVDTLTRSYDSNGRLSSAANSNGTYTFAYDNDSRLTSVHEPFGVTLTYAYDGDGNQTQVIDSLGGTQTSVYDVEDRLVTRKYAGQGQELRIDFTYDAQGLIENETRYSDLIGTSLVATTDYGYDSNGNVTSIQTNDPSPAIIDRFVYTYDHAGNLHSEVDTQNGTTTTLNYGYDADNQLTSGGANTYNYDDNGNRTGGSYSPGSGNQMSADANWTYSYYLNGGISEKDTTTALSDEHWTYTYDNANHLIEAQHYDSTNTLDLTAIYKYDVFGNRIEKDVTTGAGTAVTRFALDGWNPAKPSPIGLENFDVLADLDGSSSLTTRYIRGDGVDQPFVRIDVDISNSTYWYSTDHLHSVRALIDNDGVAQDVFTYDPFGTVTIVVNNIDAGRLLYTSREYDPETGLYEYRDRYYDPETARWISQDPIGFTGGDANLYRYVRNDPTTSVDPSGLTGGAPHPDPRIAALIAASQPTTADRLAVLEGLQRLTNPQAFAIWLNGQPVSRQNALIEMYPTLTPQQQAVVCLAMQPFLQQQQLAQAAQQPLPTQPPPAQRSLVIDPANYQLCMTPEYAAEVEANQRALYIMCIMGSMIPVPGSQVCLIWPITADLIDGNFGSAALNSAALVGGSWLQGIRLGSAPVSVSGISQLAAPGAQIASASGPTAFVGRQLNRALTAAEMAAIQRNTGLEHALIYLTGPGPNGSGGVYYLIRGTESSVSIPIASNVRLISHTHPAIDAVGVRVPLRASNHDYDTLMLLEFNGAPHPNGSLIVPEIGTPFIFNNTPIR